MDWLQEGSSGSSSTPNSGLYTPSNSFVDDSEVQGGRSVSAAELPEFDSGDVFAKLESTRLIPGRRGHVDDDLHASGGSYPYTPKNSFVDNHFEGSYQKYVFNQKDTEAITEKLRQENFFPEEEGDVWIAYHLLSLSLEFLPCCCCCCPVAYSFLGFYLVASQEEEEAMDIWKKKNTNKTNVFPPFAREMYPFYASQLNVITTVCSHTFKTFLRHHQVDSRRCCNRLIVESAFLSVRSGFFFLSR